MSGKRRVCTGLDDALERIACRDPRDELATGHHPREPRVERPDLLRPAPLQLPYEAHLADFNQNVRQTVAGFESWSSQLPLAKRPLFKPRFFHCFIPLYFDEDITGFWPK